MTTCICNDCNKEYEYNSYQKWRHKCPDCVRKHNREYKRYVRANGPRGWAANKATARRRYSIVIYAGVAPWVTDEEERYLLTGFSGLKMPYPEFSDNCAAGNFDGLVVSWDGCRYAIRNGRMMEERVEK